MYYDYSSWWIKFIVQCLNSNIQCPKSILQCLMSWQLNFLPIPSLLELDSEAAPSCSQCSQDSQCSQCSWCSWWCLIMFNNVIKWLSLLKWKRVTYSPGTVLEMLPHLKITQRWHFLVEAAKVEVLWHGIITWFTWSFNIYSAPYLMYHCVSKIIQLNKFKIVNHSISISISHLDEFVSVFL